MDATIITTAFQSAVDDTIGLLMSILPIGITVFTTVWGVRKAMKFFKATTN